MKHIWKNLSFFGVLVFGLFYFNLTHAGLLNGDFSSAFASWKGSLSDGLALTPVDPVPGAFVENFEVSGAAAILTNGETNVGVSLFQDFLIPDLTQPGNTLSLSVDFTSKASSVYDFLIAELANIASLFSTLSLVSGNVDITPLAGLDAQILFGVEDTDGITGDSVTIDNILITQQMSAISEPGTMALLLFSGSLMLVWRRRAVR